MVWSRQRGKCQVWSYAGRSTCSQSLGGSLHWLPVTRHGHRPDRQRPPPGDGTTPARGRLLAPRSRRRRCAGGRPPRWTCGRSAEARRRRCWWSSRPWWRRTRWTAENVVEPLSHRRIVPHCSHHRTAAPDLRYTVMCSTLFRHSMTAEETRKPS